jgi:hypothetical protein
LGPEGAGQLNRWYAFACVLLVFLASAARVPAGADADPFAHADWNAILRNDGGLTVVKLGDAVSARYTCIDAPDVVSGCYTGGGSSGKVNGTWLAVIPIDGMGTGGIITIVLYVWRDNGAHRLTTLGVYKCVARIEKGRLVVKQPVYAAGESNCCAKHNSITTYTVAGGKLVEISSITLPGNL